MTIVSATLSIPSPTVGRLPVRGSIGAFLRPILAIAAALAAMVALIALRLGLYAAAHSYMPIFHRLFE